MSNQEKYIDPRTGELISIDEWGIKIYYRTCADPWCKYPFSTQIESRKYHEDKCRINHYARRRRQEEQDARIKSIMRGEVQPLPRKRGKRGKPDLNYGPIPDITQFRQKTPSNEAQSASKPQEAQTPIDPPAPTKMPEFTIDQLLNMVPMDPSPPGVEADKEVTDILDKFLKPPENDSE